MTAFPSYNSFESFLHKGLYKLNDLYGKTFWRVSSFQKPVGTAQETSDAIKALLETDKPCMVARYGLTELYCLSNYLGIKQGWKNLPLFNLRTVKAVQSLGGNNDAGFGSWFDALEHMKEEIGKEDYDVCLIGCGAYGFPLAAYVKRCGKKAIHMGGALQLLFGIKGNRWEDPMYGVKEWGLKKNFYPELFNDSWVKPWSNTKPANANQVEGACYW